MFRRPLHPLHRFADDNLAGRVNSVDLKNVLGQIEADCANIHGRWLLCSGLHDSNPSWHLNAVSGSQPPHPLVRNDLKPAVA